MAPRRIRASLAAAKSSEVTDKDNATHSNLSKTGAKGGSDPTKSQEIIQKQKPPKIKRARGRKSSGTAVNDLSSKVAPSTRKRKRAEAIQDDEEEEWEELPHNMGRVKREKPAAAQGQTVGSDDVKHTKTAATGVKEEPDSKEALKLEIEVAPARKKGRQARKSLVETKSQDAVEDNIKFSEKKATPSKKATYGLTPGQTPFPDYARPTKEECYAVHKALREAHADCKPRPKTIPEPSKVVAGCGEVRAILDATIRTVLSAATTSGNANRAYQGMLARYGASETGNGKGSVDYNAVRHASVDDLEMAIRAGGLSKNKSKSIKTILDTVFDWNQQRLQELLEAKAAGPESFANVGTPYESEAMKDAEIALAQEGVLSLDRYHSWPKYEAMFQFVQLPGVGVKTAACIALFCMQRDCFAVDTHVFRMSQWLGWVPDAATVATESGKKNKKVDRDTTFSHLEVRIPDELKYDLHQLFITHGKKCPRCRAATGESSEGWSLGCPIDHLLTRTGARKGGLSPVKGGSSSKPKGVGKAKKRKDSDEDNDDEDVSMPELDDEDDDEKVETVMSKAKSDKKLKSPAAKASKVAKRGTRSRAK